MAITRMGIRWVRRNWPVGATPYIIREDQLPRGQKILVFLPHADDGRFIGATLSLLNKSEDGRTRNRVRIVVVCPGYHSVEGDLSNEEKGGIRREEATCWGRKLGFGEDQMLFFGAEETYASRRCAPTEQTRMEALVRDEKPTMVFVTHRSDIAQHTNHCARNMALKSVASWMDQEFRQGHRREVFVVEFPTLHVPILPPADKNLIIAFSDPAFPMVKHEANACHRSQEVKYFEMMGRFVEAIDALSGADVVCEARRAGDQFSKRLSDVSLNPVKSRGEHFGVTRMRVRQAGGDEAALVEERVHFPLLRQARQRWGLSDLTLLTDTGLRTTL